MRRARELDAITPLSRIAQRHARWIIACAVALTLVAAVGAAAWGDRLSSGGFDVPGSQAVHQRDVIEEASGISPGAGVIVLIDAPDGADAPATRALVTRATQALRTAGEIAEVRTPYGPGGAVQVARDGRSVFVEGRFSPGGDDARMAATRHVRDALADAPAVRVGGPYAVFDEVTSTVISDLARAEIIVLPVLFLLALWVFRGAVAAALMPLMGVMVIEGAYFAVTAINFATTMSVFSLNLIVAIGLGLAVDYSLLMITRFRQELDRGHDRGAALDVTMRTAGVSVAFSAVTVAAALSGLMVFPMNFLFSMGLGGLIVALLAGSAALVVLPAVLWLLGPRIDAWAPRRWQHRPSEGAHAGAWYRLAHAVLRRPAVVAIATGAVLVALALPSLGLHFIPVDATVMPTSATSRQVADRIERDFRLDTGSTMNVALETTGPGEPQQAARACAASMARRTGVQAVTPPVAAAPRVWSFAVVSRTPPLSDASVDLVERLRTTSCAGRVSVGGVAADFVDQRAAIAQRLPLAIGIVALVTIVALFLMTGSVLLPLKAVLLNVLSIGATLGIVVWIFQDGHLEGLLAFESRGGLGLTQPILLGAVAFGLSTDYAVFLLSRIREVKLAGHTNRESVAQGLEHTGRVVTSAALLFAVAVGAFAMSRVIVLKEIGVGTALAVLIDASIVRALLVPSTMGILGSANWWAPGPLRRLHDRIGVREHDSLGSG